MAKKEREGPKRTGNGQNMLQNGLNGPKRTIRTENSQKDRRGQKGPNVILKNGLKGAKRTRRSENSQRDRKLPKRTKRDLKKWIERDKTDKKGQIWPKMTWNKGDLLIY